jgi:hypothetical protein
VSANNWVVCPRCKRDREAHIRNLQQKVNAAYGSLPIEAFDDLRAAVDGEKAGKLDATLREDWEIYGADDGVVKVDYSSFCNVCGLRVTFEFAYPIPDVTEPPESRST